MKDEYLGFLRALAGGTLLAQGSRQALLGNQRGTATVVSSPAWNAVAEDWSYGLGNWLECPTATELGTYDCGEGHRNSSPGAYGAYPFIDFDHGYFGIVARRGRARLRPRGRAHLPHHRRAGPAVGGQAVRVGRRHSSRAGTGPSRRSARASPRSSGRTGGRGAHWLG